LGHARRRCAAGAVSGGEVGMPGMPDKRSRAACVVRNASGILAIRAGDGRESSFGPGASTDGAKRHARRVDTKQGNATT